jgi:hypothetical protein
MFTRGGEVEPRRRRRSKGNQFSVLISVGQFIFLPLICKTRETARGGHFEYVVLEGVEGKN